MADPHSVQEEVQRWNPGLIPEPVAKGKIDAEDWHLIAGLAWGLSGYLAGASSSNPGALRASSTTQWLASVAKNETFQKAAKSDATKAQNKQARWKILIETATPLLEGNREVTFQPLTVYLPCHYLPQEHFDHVPEIPAARRCDPTLRSGPSGSDGSGPPGGSGKTPPGDSGPPFLRGPP